MEGDTETSGGESCNVCSRLERLFIEDGMASNSFNPNDLKQSQRECALHEPVISWLYETFHKEAQDLASRGADRLRSRGYYTIWFLRDPGRPPQAAFVDYKYRYQRWYDLFLLDSKSEQGRSSSCRQPFDSKWINLQVARQWLDTCFNKHQAKCQASFKIPICSPAYMIDTELDCLVHGKPALQYVALSYRWGTRESFKTSTSTLTTITTPGGLSTYTDGIPVTVRHAMRLVRELGERYLWVDSLCLISDDKQHMSEQLQLMGSIYAGAKLTIIATDGDAWDGILGIQGVSEPRGLRNVFPWLNGSKIIVRDNPSLSGHASSGSEYFQRGWTYQEYFLSQRRLIFANRQLHWSCLCATWHEDDVEARQDIVVDDDKAAKYTRIPDILAGQPSFGELGLLMGEYVVRNFTHPEDALPGVTGLLTFLRHTFNGGFQCGLPETWFDVALMWNCYFSNREPSGYVPTAYLKQRKPMGPRQSYLPGAILPSWSYISWEMNYLRLLDDEEDYQLPGWFPTATSRFKFITTPVTTWFSHDAPESLYKRRIDSFPDRNFTGAGDSKYFIEGWLKEKLDPVKHFVDGFKFTSEQSEWETPAQHVYYHPALPNKYFWRPFSLPTLDQANRDTKQHQYISCRTNRGWFHGRNLGFGDFVCPSSLFILNMETHVALANKSGMICGWLQLPSHDDAQRFLLTTTERLGDIVSGSKYESDYLSSWGSDSSESGNNETSNGDIDSRGGITSGNHDSNSKETEPVFELDVEIVAICHRKRSNQGGLVTGREAEGNEFYGVLWIEWSGGVAHRRGCGYVEKTMWDACDLEEIDLVLG